MYICVYLTKLHFLRKIIFSINLYLKCRSISSLPIACNPCISITIRFFVPIKIMRALFQLLYYTNLIFSVDCMWSTSMDDHKRPYVNSFSNITKLCNSIYMYKFIIFLYKSVWINIGNERSCTMNKELSLTKISDNFYWKCFFKMHFF